jgi:hypothetical protein
VSRKIAEYMQVLTESSEARDEHRRDSRGAMERFGLTVEEQEIVLTGDHEQIRAAIASVDASLAREIRITTIPPPPPPPPPPRPSR